MGVIAGDDKAPSRCRQPRGFTIERLKVGEVLVGEDSVTRS